MTLDSIILISGEYRHLDKRVERLPEGEYVNTVLKDFWHAIKKYIEENHPEVIP